MISDDIRHFLTALLLVVGSLLPIVNPVGSAPMFLAMTRGADVATRQIQRRSVARHHVAVVQPKQTIAVGTHQHVAIGAFADPSFPPPTVSVYEERQHHWTANASALEMVHHR